MVTSLQSWMAKEDLDCFIVPSDDPHLRYDWVWLFPAKNDPLKQDPLKEEKLYWSSEIVETLPENSSVFTK